MAWNNQQPLPPYYMGGVPQQMPGGVPQNNGQTFMGGVPVPPGQQPQQPWMMQGQGGGSMMQPRPPPPQYPQVISGGPLNFIPSAKWTGAKRGYVFTNRIVSGLPNQGYFKDILVESSEAHKAAASRQEAKAAEEARKAKMVAEKAEAEAEQLKLAREAEALERKIAEKPPLEALAERYALKQAQAAQEAARLKLEKMQKALMIENGQAEPEVEVEQDDEQDDEDDEDDVGGAVKLTPEQRKIQETIIQQETFDAFNKARLEKGETVLSLEEWEEEKLKEKAKKQQEWFTQENDRRKQQGMPVLDFEGWLAMEAEKKKEKKRAKAREKGKHQTTDSIEDSGLELAIVPGQMWAAARSGIPEHLPEAMKTKIMKKLMDEVILRPSPEQEERIRIANLEREKAQLAQSEESKQGVMSSLDKAVSQLEELAWKLPAVQRRRKQMALKAKERQLKASRDSVPSGEVNGSEVGGEDEEDEEVEDMSAEEIAKALSEPVKLDESSFSAPKRGEAMAARYHQSQLQTNARTQALQQHPTNPMMGMMAATAAVTALNTATPQDIELYTKLGKSALLECQFKRNKLGAESSRGHNQEKEGDESDDAEDKKSMKSKKSKKSKRDRRDRSRSVDSVDSYDSKRDSRHHGSRRDHHDRYRGGGGNSRRSYDRRDRRRSRSRSNGRYDRRR